MIGPYANPNAAADTIASPRFVVVLHTTSATSSGSRPGRSSPVAARSAANSRMFAARRSAISSRIRASSASCSAAPLRTTCSGASREFTAVTAIA